MLSVLFLAAAIRVTPSEAVEERVRAEVAKAAEVIAAVDSGNLFESPYLASAIYYSDGLLDGFPDGDAGADPNRRIVARLYRLLTPEMKERYVRLLRQAYEESFPEGGDSPLLPPLSGGKGRRSSRAHRDAVDLFAPEGSTVRSATRGVVVLAEGGWRAGEPFSTSSQKGGNCVIVYHAGGDRFFRYCHLEGVTVRAGDAVEAGAPIGAVGHTGWNASRRGHGGHLHLEANQYRGGSVRALTASELWTMLRPRGLLSGSGK